MQLLRVRTRKGEILPSFCTTDEADETQDLQLAKEIITEFAHSASNREKKSQLYQRLERLESRHEDFKLVRGFAALLERRCQFSSGLVANFGTSRISAETDSEEGKQERNSNTIVTTTQNDVGIIGEKNHSTFQSSIVDPILIRKALFVESSKSGFALTEFERERIIDTVASNLKIHAMKLEGLMWSDLEDNMVLQRFDAIDARQLLGWYNLSLAQTLLFNCTKFEFTVYGGTNWKRVLRNVKRLGLMYYLEHKSLERQDSTSTDDDNNNNNNNNPVSELELHCSIDGPLSIFKLTEKYGTSIAKLLPAIVSAQRWSLYASIVRKTMSGKKIYQFRLSSSDAPALIGKALYANNVKNDSNNSSNSSGSIGSHNYQQDYDSTVEEKFANRLKQSANGWKITKEPDPFIVSGGRAFIADFLLEKYRKKVYVEIVGFWTKEYLERKMQKISKVFSDKNIDLFMAINENLACSKVSSSSLSAPPNDRIIIYKNDSVPVRAVLDHLRKIDDQMVQNQVSDSNLTIKLDKTSGDVISIAEIAAKYNIAIESAIKVAERDNPDDFIRAGEYFISKEKASSLAELLRLSDTLSEASQILIENLVPESCHIDLLSKLGFDIVWKNMDASSACISRKK